MVNIRRSQHKEEYQHLTKPVIDVNQLEMLFDDFVDAEV